MPSPSKPNNYGDLSQAGTHHPGDEPTLSPLCSGSAGQKRKAAPAEGSPSGVSERITKYRDYWKRDNKTGWFYHVYPNGTISWLGEEEEGGDDLSDDE